MGDPVSVGSNHLYVNCEIEEIKQTPQWEPWNRQDTSCAQTHVYPTTHVQARQHDKRSVCPRNKQNANTRVVLLLSHTPNYVLNLCNIAFMYHIDNVNI